MNNDYALELYQGPLLAPNRTMGLAGATTAVAEAVEGVYNNAAAPAVRESYSLSWFEWEPSVGIALPGAYGGTDFNNLGDRAGKQAFERTDRFLYLQAGLWFQFGKLGFNATADQLRYDVVASEQRAPLPSPLPSVASSPSLSLAMTRMHLVGAYSLLGNQLCIGGGVRGIYANIDEVNTDKPTVIGLFGIAPEAGVIVKPDDVPWRIGATARAGVNATSETSGRIKRAGTFITPDRITQPWELEAGVAYQLGPRPLNPAWIDPDDHADQVKANIERARLERASMHRAEIASMPASTYEEVAARELRLARISAEEDDLREEEDKILRNASARLEEERRARYANWPRERVLLLASLILTGPSDRAVALEGLMDQKLEVVGKGLSIAPRFAVESEPIANWVKLRTGVYFEPSRFSDGTYRQHFTFGADLKLFPWDVFGILNRAQTWRLGSFLDIAPRYQNFGFAIGVWH